MKRDSRGSYGVRGTLEERSLNCCGIGNHEGETLVNSSGDWWSSTRENGWVNEDNHDNEIHYNGYSVNGKEVGGWQKGKRKEKPTKGGGKFGGYTKGNGKDKGKGSCGRSW